MRFFRVCTCGHSLVMWLCKNNVHVMIRSNSFVAGLSTVSEQCMGEELAAWHRPSTMSVDWHNIVLDHMVSK